MRRGDTFGVPVWLDSFPALIDDEHDEDDEEDDEASSSGPSAIVYFRVTAISYEPLVALQDDFRSSTSSKARAGELGCWIDVGSDGTTQMILEGLERERISARWAEKAWHSIRESRMVLAPWLTSNSAVSSSFLEGSYDSTAGFADICPP